MPDPSSHPAAGDDALFYDWNRSERPVREVGVVDETLRDGLQSPSVQDPSTPQKLALLQQAVALGVDGFALGFPASRPRQFEDALRLAQEAANQRFEVKLCCAARTLIADIEPVARIAQRAGVLIQVGMFIGASPLRQMAEGWSLSRALTLTEDAVRFAAREGLEVLYVAEDATRTPPATLEQLYRTAIACGARRVCVADTVGQATPEGAENLIRFVRQLVDGIDPRIAIEWHGHRDRGLAVANCLAAWRAGAELCHGTAFGVGERCGNPPIELLLTNLALLGHRKFDLSHLPDYAHAAQTALGVPIPPNQPVVGRDAFRTATGAHAAALGKAMSRSDTWLADRVFSAVPASWVGRLQRIEIGPASGEANVLAWLSAHAVSPSTELVRAILQAAKSRSRLLDDAEILAITRETRPGARTASSKSR
ncbi:MAG TPA: LeuA family protein [Polyangiaceae bacterium]|nr:LeuA family protein [Polyangiaceae bacterium]